MSGQEFAPAAIVALFAAVQERLPFPVELGGIVGDQAHTYGYHRARAVLPADDYSVVLPRDQRGRPWAAAALDITPADAGNMPILTRRLATAAAAGDPRLHVLREFYGSLDREHVFGWDVRFGRPETSDTSHLWHLHLSFRRDVAHRRRKLLPLADVLAGPSIE